MALTQRMFPRLPYLDKAPAPVQGWFTEAFDSAGLKAARALRGELGPEAAGGWLNRRFQPVEAVKGEDFGHSFGRRSGVGVSAAEYARLKGERDALETVAIKKDCGIDVKPIEIEKKSDSETS